MFQIILLISAFVIVAPTRAHAYIDPGTGSYFFQILLAAVISGAFGIKIYWQKIRQLFKRPPTPEKNNDSAKRD